MMAMTMVMLMIGTRALPVRVGKMTMTMTMVIAMVMLVVDGDTVVPVRVGKSDVTFHGDTDCHVQRTHLKMFLGRIPVMMRRMICFQKLTRPMWARGRPHKTEFRQ